MLKWLMARRTPKQCPCCGALLPQVLNWLDAWNDVAVNQQIPLIWGTAVMLRMIHPEDTWADPIFEQEFHMVRQGREGYSDPAPGFQKQSEEGDKQLLKLIEKLKMILDQEVTTDVLEKERET